MWLRLLTLLFLLLGLPAQGADVHLAWDPNTETDLAGYRLYRGTQSRQYTESKNVGNVTNYTWTVPDADQFFAATAYNSAGESEYSNEVQWSPAPQPIQPATNVNVSWSEVEQTMATPPTLINKYESAWNTTNDKTIMSAVAIQAGDLIVIMAAVESDTGIFVLSEDGGASAVLQYDDIGNAPIGVWTYEAAANETITITLGRSGFFGAVAYHFRNHGGLGTKNSASGATGDPAATLSNVAANSAICMIVSDWNAISGAQAANTAIGTFTPATGYPGDAARYGVFAGYYPDVGAAGNKTIGQTTPDGLDWAIAGIEVKGTASATGNPHYAYAQQ